MKRWLPTVVWLAVGFSACGPVIEPCNAQSCAGGCCDSSGVCVAGRTRFACGVGGATCAVCTELEVCLEGATCGEPPRDAGAEDAGREDAGAGEDAGVDAGPLRTVTVRRGPEVLQTDGGTSKFFNSIAISDVALWREAANGDWDVSTAGLGGGNSVRFENVPQGPYTIVFLRNGVRSILVSDSDEVDFGPRIVGRRSQALSPGTFLRIDAGVELPSLPGDTLSLTSFNAGHVRDAFTTSRTPDGSVYGATDLATATQPFNFIAGDDDLTIVLHRSYPDAGPATLNAALQGVTVVAPSIPSGQTTVMTPPQLAVLPRESASILLRSSDFTQFLGDVNPQATVGSQRFLIHAAPASPATDGGGDFDGRSATLLSLARSSALDLAADVSWADPFGARAPERIFRGLSGAVIPLSHENRTLNRVTDVLTTTRRATANASLGPEMSPPRFVRINGATAFVNRNGVSLTPTFEWSAPVLGTPTHYSVALWTIATSGTGLTQTFLATAVTPWPRYHVPPGLLQAGQAYFALVTAHRVQGNDVRVTPNRTSREAADGTACTNVFTP